MTECARTPRHVNVPSHANAFITDRGIGCLFLNGALFEVFAVAGSCLQTVRAEHFNHAIASCSAVKMSHTFVPINSKLNSNTSTVPFMVLFFLLHSVELFFNFTFVLFNSLFAQHVLFYLSFTSQHQFVCHIGQIGPYLVT